MEKNYGDYQKDLEASDRKQIDFPIYGLVNPIKTYNCFLNSVMQAFWMIDTFRHFFSWYSSMNSANDNLFIQELKCFFREILKTPKNEFDNSLKSYYLKDLREQLSIQGGKQTTFLVGEM